MKTIDVPDSYVLTEDDKKILAKRAKKTGHKLEELEYHYIAEKNMKNATKMLFEFQLALNGLHLKFEPKLEFHNDSIKAAASLSSYPPDIMKADRARLEGGIQAFSTVPNLIKKA